MSSPMALIRIQFFQYTCISSGDSTWVVRCVDGRMRTASSLGLSLAPQKLNVELAQMLTLQRLMSCMSRSELFPVFQSTTVFSSSPSPK